MTQLILCQTPTKGWVNLAYVRQIQFRRIHIHRSLQITCLVTWSNGDKEAFFAKDAEAIAQALNKQPYHSPR
ncbi:hypothetical protein [Fischerella sp. PCC 9605]|uniref:hypothetical protein n=1 Tax=Fischerella sp. PCC 9605 TaxID=1173024 RepID=UPI000478B90F|nr:hypothetical protein [Fischerella sp. PCC 9605]